MPNYRVLFNTDSDVVKKIKEALVANDGYCPCSIIRTDDTKCMCKEFKQQIKDDSFTGYCHCGLYYKEEVVL